MIISIAAGASTTPAGKTPGYLKNLSDKTLGLVETGASGVQLTPKFGSTCEGKSTYSNDALSSVSIRENPPIDPAISASLETGRRTASMKDFADILQGDGFCF